MQKHKERSANYDTLNIVSILTHYSSKRNFFLLKIYINLLSIIKSITITILHLVVFITTYYNY